MHGLSRTAVDGVPSNSIVAVALVQLKPEAKLSRIQDTDNGSPGVIGAVTVSVAPVRCGATARPPGQFAMVKEKYEMPTFPRISLAWTSSL